MRLLLLFFTLFSVGCTTTANKDDYAKHVNSIATENINELDFKFGFPDDQKVDFRGVYSQDNSVNATPIMYLGGAGLAGFFAQILTHSAMINSQRDKKLSKEQIEANERISPLISLAEEISLLDLIDEHSPQRVELQKETSGVFITKPIFFSNSEMTKLSLKLIVLLPSEEENSQAGQNQKSQYKNMVHVLGSELNETQQKRLVSDKDYLSKRLSSLLVTALNITKNDAAGRYSKIRSTDQTFFINDGSGEKVIRGSIIGQECGYQIIQDLHSWLIASPKSEEIDNENSLSITDC